MPRQPSPLRASAANSCSHTIVAVLRILFGRTSQQVRQRQSELRDIATRSREVVLLAGVAGLTTGLAVALFEWLSVQVSLDRLLDADPLVQGAAIAAALPIVALILFAGGRLSPSTTDEYIKHFHDGQPLRLRDLPVRFAAAVAGLGLGVPMGLEGPSMYTGASIGSAMQERAGNVFTMRYRRTLLVAGAAAGVAAIFRAPATGAVFALEVPYRSDLGRRLLLPALVGAACGYLAFAAVHGTAPLFSVGNATGIAFRDLIGAILLGVGGGLLTRGFAWMLRAAKHVQEGVALVPRVAVASVALVGLFAAGRLLYGESLVISPGYNAVSWATDPKHGLGLVAALLVLRCVATSTAVAGGGVGGLFIPLVVTGALIGRLVGGEIHALDQNLYTVLGVAAALGAGYQVPLAAVTFVAEVAGRPQYVVLGLLAAVAADLVSMQSSVTEYQRDA
jgi:CIC family chloride channel protein